MTDFSRFRSTIASCQHKDFDVDAPSSPKLLIPEASDHKVQTYYAPFDFINKEAKIVFVGITPGRQQMNNALRVACEEIQNGRSDKEVLIAAKRTASFSGEMRKNLVKTLDAYGLHRRLNLKSSGDLWAKANHLVHFTSALRNPVFTLFKGMEQNYTGGSPNLARYRAFKNTLQNLRTELLSIENALIIPLGDKVAQVVQQLVNQADIPLCRVLNNDGCVAEFPHPSPANQETQNLVLDPEMPSKNDYAQKMLGAYLAKKDRAGGEVTPEQRTRYLGIRHSYWDRAQHTRTALQNLPSVIV